jgi:hypothetical protein
MRLYGKSSNSSSIVGQLERACASSARIGFTRQRRFPARDSSIRLCRAAKPKRRVEPSHPFLVCIGYLG